MRWLAALALLAACASSPGFRDPGVAITSTTRYQAERLQGRWLIRARFAGPEAPLSPAEVRFSLGPGGQITAMETHGVSPGGRFAVTQTAPGRFRDARARAYWLLWVDADWRTLAMGAPDGRFGWILSRDSHGGEDRIKAAREVFEWVGYDMARLTDLQ